MKRQFTICVPFLAVLALIMTMTGTMGAQMAVSHTPTNVAKQQQPSTNLAVGKPVARVNGTILTERDLQREMYTMFPYAAQHNGQVPPELAPQIRAGALKMIIFEELLYQEALRRQMSVSPAKLQKAEADFKAQFSSAAEYRQFVNQEFLGSEKALHEKIRRSLLIEAMLKKEVDDKSTVSASDAKAYYDKNPSRFEYAEAFAFQTISILPPSQPTDANLKEMRKRAEDALTQARATTSYEQFGTLAEKISEDDYRVMMGDHKKVERAKLAPQVVQALLAMKPGEISDIIQINQAYTVIRLKQHIPAGKAKFEDVKASVEQELQKQKVERARAALDKRLRQTAKVEEL